MRMLGCQKVKRRRGREDLRMIGQEDVGKKLGDSARKRRGEKIS